MTKILCCSGGPHITSIIQFVSVGSGQTFSNNLERFVFFSSTKYKISFVHIDYRTWFYSMLISYDKNTLEQDFKDSVQCTICRPHIL